MNRRTYESPMEWEYQNRGPVDPTSPFTHAAQGRGLQNGFASPSKESASSRPNPFASPSKEGASSRPNPFATPSKSQQPRPLFTPQHGSLKPSAPAFRNPAFTTPRKPFDEVVLSEASGAEDSPALTETSDFPNDTPEADRMSDVNMGGSITPAKVDKTFRYQKGGLATRKNMSGRGEIRSHRDLGADVTRRRRRQGVANYARHQYQDSDDDSEDGLSASSRHRSRHKNSRKAVRQGGMIGSMFHMMEEHRTAPENLHRWIQLGINVFVGVTVCVAVMAVIHAVRSDVLALNEASRNELRIKKAACQDEYNANHCATTNAPAFKKMCSEWYDCMMQDENSIRRVRATMTEVAHIMNDFFGTLNLKAWGAFMGFLVFMVFANNTMLGKPPNTTSTHVSGPHPPNKASGPPMPHQSADIMWIPVQTPQMQRRSVFHDDTDTDGTPPRSQKFLPPFTPSGRRSPSKRGRSVSPVKYMRSEY